MKYFQGGLLAVLCIFIFGAASTRAEDARYCFNDWPPYTYLDDTGQAAGISIDILKQASHRAGYEPVFTELPWERCLRDVEIGEQDAVIDAAKREGYLQGDISFSVYTNTFWLRDGNDGAIPLQPSFEGQRLGLVRGYVYGADLDKQIAQSGAIIDYAQDDWQNVRMLSYGRTNAIIGDYVSTRIFAMENGLDVKPVLPHHSFDRLYPSFNLGQGVKHAKINTALAEMLEDGTIDRVYQDALGVPFTDIMPNAESSMNPDHQPLPDSDLTIAGF